MRLKKALVPFSKIGYGDDSNNEELENIPNMNDVDKIMGLGKRDIQNLRYKDLIALKERLSDIFSKLEISAEENSAEDMKKNEKKIDDILKEWQVDYNSRDVYGSYDNLMTYIEKQEEITKKREKRTRMEQREISRRLSEGKPSHPKTLEEIDNEKQRELEETRQRLKPIKETIEPDIESSDRIATPKEVEEEQKESRKGIKTIDADVDPVSSDVDIDKIKEELNEESEEIKEKLDDADYDFVNDINTSKQRAEEILNKIVDTMVNEVIADAKQKSDPNLISRLEADRIKIKKHLKTQMDKEKDKAEFIQKIRSLGQNLFGWHITHAGEFLKTIKDSDLVPRISLQKKYKTTIPMLRSLFREKNAKSLFVQNILDRHKQRNIKFKPAREARKNKVRSLFKLK